jgi:hypothetical protein
VFVVGSWAYLVKWVTKSKKPRNVPKVLSATVRDSADRKRSEKVVSHLAAIADFCRHVGWQCVGVESARNHPLIWK